MARVYSPQSAQRAQRGCGGSDQDFQKHRLSPLPLCALFVLCGEYTFAFALDEVLRAAHRDYDAVPGVLSIETTSPGSSFCIVKRSLVDSSGSRSIWSRFFISRPLWAMRCSSSPFGQSMRSMEPMAALYFSTVPCNALPMPERCSITFQKRLKSSTPAS